MLPYDVADYLGHRAGKGVFTEDQNLRFGMCDRQLIQSVRRALIFGLFQLHARNMKRRCGQPRDESLGSLIPCHAESRGHDTSEYTSITPVTAAA